LPESLLSPNKWNPSGYWEPSSAVRLNARFLRDSGSSFFDTLLVNDISEDAPLGREFVAEIAELLQGYTGTDVNASLIVKDPRISVLLPFWLAAAARVNLSPRVVIAVRHPNEVASSLGAWKGLPAVHTAELWLKYNLLAERHTRHLPRAFISYTRLLANWRREVLAISEALGLSLTPNDEVDQFLSPGYRHMISDNEAVSIDTPWLREVYTALSSACRGGQLDTNVLDAAFLDFSQAQASGTLPTIRSIGPDFGLAPSHS